MILVWLDFIISSEYTQNTRVTHVHKSGISMQRDIFIERRTGSGLILLFVHQHRGAS